mgnify:CR=1 FL=1
MNGASEHPTTTRPPANLQLAGARQKTFDTHLGFSAQRNDKFGRTRLVALRPMAQKAPARACRSSLSGCWRSLSSLAVAVFMRRLCPFACSLAGELALRVAAQVGTTGRPPVRSRTRARPPEANSKNFTSARFGIARGPHGTGRASTDDPPSVRPAPFTKSSTAVNIPRFSSTPPARVMSISKIRIILTAPIMTAYQAAQNSLVSGVPVGAYAQGR